MVGEYAWAGQYPTTSHEPVSYLFALGTNNCLHNCVLRQEQVSINDTNLPKE